MKKLMHSAVQAAEHERRGYLGIRELQGGTGHGCWCVSVMVRVEWFRALFLYLLEKSPCRC